MLPFKQHLGAVFIRYLDVDNLPAGNYTAVCGIQYQHTNSPSPVRPVMVTNVDGGTTITSTGAGKTRIRLHALPDSTKNWEVGTHKGDITFKSVTDPNLLISPEDDFYIDVSLRYSGKL